LKVLFPSDPRRENFDSLEARGKLSYRATTNNYFIYIYI